MALISVWYLTPVRLWQLRKPIFPDERSNDSNKPPDLGLLEFLRRRDVLALRLLMASNCQLVVIYRLDQITAGWRKPRLFAVAAHQLRQEVERCNPSSSASLSNCAGCYWISVLHM